MRITHSFKTLSLCVVATLMTACASFSGGDLTAADSPISDSDRILAQRLAQAGLAICKTYTYREGPTNERISDYLTPKSATVKRLFKSDTPWIKGTVILDDAWGDVFLHTDNNRATCGHENFAKIPNTSGIVFTEVIPAK